MSHCVASHTFRGRLGRMLMSLAKVLFDDRHREYRRRPCGADIALGRRRRSKIRLGGCARWCPCHRLAPVPGSVDRSLDTNIPPCMLDGSLPSAPCGADRIAPTQGCALGDNCDTHTFTSSLSQAHHAFVQGDKPARDIDAVCSNMLRGNAGGRCCDACRPRAAPIFGPPSPMATGETRDRACVRARTGTAGGRVCPVSRNCNRQSRCGKSLESCCGWVRGRERARN